MRRYSTLVLRTPKNNQRKMFKLRRNAFLTSYKIRAPDKSFHRQREFFSFPLNRSKICTWEEKTRFWYTFRIHAKRNASAIFTRL